MLKNVTFHSKLLAYQRTKKSSNPTTHHTRSTNLFVVNHHLFHEIPIASRYSQLPSFLIAQGSEARKKKVSRRASSVEFATMISLPSGLPWGSAPAWNTKGMLQGSVENDLENCEKFCAEGLPLRRASWHKITRDCSRVYMSVTFSCGFHGGFLPHMSFEA